MEKLQVVIDTNVVVAALRSRRGASYQLLLSINRGHFDINISVPLFLEYEDVCQRLVGEIELTARDIRAVLDYLCTVAHRRNIFYLWRPFLNDPKDDMVLEVAVASACDYIVTFNQADFRGAEQFGIRVVTPKEFLKEVGELP